MYLCNVYVFIFFHLYISGSMYPWVPDVISYGCCGLLWGFIQTPYIDCMYLILFIFSSYIISYCFFIAVYSFVYNIVFRCDCLSSSLAIYAGVLASQVCVPLWRLGRLPGGWTGPYHGTAVLPLAHILVWAPPIGYKASAQCGSLDPVTSALRTALAKCHRVGDYK